MSNAVKKKVAKKSASHAVTPPDPVRITMTVNEVAGAWKWQFYGPQGVVLDSEGILKFTGFPDRVHVAIVIVDSPGITWMDTGDACIGFAKDACPTSSNLKDKDVFKQITVSPDRSVLSFDNHNKKGLFYYALFVCFNGNQIPPHDPIIINKNRVAVR